MEHAVAPTPGGQVTAGQGGAAVTPASFADAGVVELRRYTLHPGGFRDLSNLFEAHIITGQEERGILVGGIFADVDRSDRFVWWRAFVDMESRQRALEAFYYGPVWAAHNERANATMIDSDDVVLLRHTRPARPGPAPRTGVIDVEDAVATLIVRHDGSSATEGWLSTEVSTMVQSTLGGVIATWRTEPADNTFARLPVRPEPAFVLSATFPSAEERDAALQRLRDEPTWQAWRRELTAAPDGDVDVMRLRPIPGSKHPAWAPTSKGQP